MKLNSNVEPEEDEEDTFEQTGGFSSCGACGGSGCDWCMDMSEWE